MYHYVRNFEKKLPYFRYLSVDSFKKQLLFFKDKYGFISKDEFIDVINENIKPPKDKIILTFDDGLIDHYKFVYPILKEMKLWGVFYIPTAQFTDKKILPVHLIHLLCGSIQPKKLINQLNSLIKDYMIPDKKIKSFRDDTYNNQKNVEDIYLFKRTLNFYIDYKYRFELINSLMNLNNLSFNTKDVYLDQKQLLEMSKDMIIGSHSHSHPVFSKLSYKEQQNDISKSFLELSRIINRFTIKSFCYPYGGDHVFNINTIKILEKENCKFAFNVDPRDINHLDLKINKLRLPRYDCNEFKYGKVEPLKN